MNNEEAIKGIKYLAEYDGNPFCAGNRAEIRNKLLEYFDKYRWHDLRKNPQDLPKERGSIMCAYISGAKIIYASAECIPATQCHGCEWYADNEYIDDFCDVIAWREIEPFEEEE